MSKFALITGGSSGIGRALADEFGADGYNLILVAKDSNRLAQAADELRQANPRMEIITISKDLAQPQSGQELFDEISARGIFVDALVNDAGVGHKGNFSEIPLEDEIEILRINVEMLTRLTKLFLTPMLKRNEGKILNVGSIAGFQPGPLLAVYHASKAYVVSLSEALAEELKATKITVTCLCPGATDTNFFQGADMEDSRIVKSGQLMDPQEVAKGAYQAFKNGERLFVPGATNKILTFMRRLMPESTQARINKKFYESGREPNAT